MKIKKIKYLAKYKCFDKDYIINFNDDNCLLIIGKNGTGKSIILESILLAFYNLELFSLGKDINRTFHGLIECELEYEKNNKIYRLTNNKYIITISEGGNIVFNSRNNSDFKKLDALLPNYIFIVSNGYNEKLDIIGDTADLIRRIKNHIYYKNNTDSSERPKFVTINNACLNALAEVDSYFFQENTDNDVLKQLKRKINFKEKSRTHEESEYIAKFVNNPFMYYLRIWNDRIDKKDFSIKKYTQTWRYKTYYEQDFYFNNTNAFFLYKYYSSNDFMKASNGEFDFFRYFLTMRTTRELEDCLIFCDEIDSHFDPEWQKDFMYIAKKYINNTSQMIISTNSPYIIADEKTENIIYIDGYFQKSLDFQTFGSNTNIINKKIFDCVGTLSKRASENIANINKNDKQSLISNLEQMGESPEKNLLIYEMEMK